MGRGAARLRIGGRPAKGIASRLDFDVDVAHLAGDRIALGKKQNGGAVFGVQLVIETARFKIGHDLELELVALIRGPESHSGHEREIGPKHDQAENSAHDQNGQENPEQIDSDDPHRLDLVVLRKATCRQQNSDQKRHGNGDGEKSGQVAAQKLEDQIRPNAAIEKEIGEPEDLADQKKKGENEKTQDGGPDEFFEDVALKNPGQCVLLPTMAIFAEL